MTVTHWKHLPHVEVDEDGGLTMEDRNLTMAEVAKAFKAATTKEWNRIWEELTPKKWPEKLFPTMYDRLRIKEAPTFWTSQAISDHGCFKGYLLRIGRKTTNLCPCGFGDVETAEHVLTDCLRFTDGRPLDWHKLEEYHLPYMQKVILKLWKLENPNFQLKNADYQ